MHPLARAVVCSWVYSKTKELVDQMSTCEVFQVREAGGIKRGDFMEEFDFDLGMLGALK